MSIFTVGSCYDEVNVPGTRLLMRSGAVFLLLFLQLAASAIAGDWRVVDLHPAGARASEAWGAGGQQIVGRALYSPYHPVLWDVDTGAIVDLLPAGLSYGEMHNTDGHQQVGLCSGGSPWAFHGPLWTRSADSYVDLNPGPPYQSAQLSDVSSGLQAGFALTGGYQHAAIWHSTPESFVDLHPSGALWSEALATDGVLQGGRAYRLPGTTEIHTVLWHGTVASWVDMNPPGSRESRIQGMADGIQVGWGLFGTHEYGCIWRGTPESVVVLYLPNASTTRLYDTTGRYHAV